MIYYPISMSTTSRLISTSLIALSNNDIKNVNTNLTNPTYKQVSLTAVNYGQVLQVDYPEGSSIMISEQKFELLQFHFHTPSETIHDGNGFDMEMHLVYKNANNHLGVVGVFFKKGEENATLKTILGHLPQTENAPETFADIQINATSLLPRNANHYGFDGPLTTPPYNEGVTEGVEWSVMRAPLQMSEAQLTRFIELFHHNNARPVRTLNGRQINIS